MLLEQVEAGKRPLRVLYCLTARRGRDGPDGWVRTTHAQRLRTASIRPSCLMQYGMLYTGYESAPDNNNGSGFRNKLHRGRETPEHGGASSSADLSFKKR
jgi:hypothetical protein